MQQKIEKNSSGGDCYALVGKKKEEKKRLETGNKS